MTYFEITLYALAVLCMITLPLLVAVSVRIAKTLAHLSGQMLRLSDAEIDQIARRLGHKLGLSDEASLMSIADRMDEMRSDFDWLQHRHQRVGTGGDPQAAQALTRCIYSR